MRLLLAALPLVALGLSACSRNPDTPAGRAADARHESFEHIGDSFKATTDQLKAPSPNLGAIRNAAGTINRLAPKVESWFVAGSGPADGIKTDALQTVWTKPVEFKQAAAKFADEASKFNDVAQTGDVAAIGAGLKTFGGACKNCHDRFREKD